MGVFSKIEFDYSVALTQASKLEEIAHNIQKETTKMLDTIDALRGSWQGEAATSYATKGRLLADKTQTTAKDLLNAASKIRSIAKKIRDAEKAAQAIANKRSY